MFISYRREDAQGFAGRLREDLRNRGVPVFRDLDDLEPGVLFADEIRRQLKSATACLVMIGPRWLSCTGSAGKPRLDDPNDLLRVEVATALRLGLRTIPVLVQDAKMPRREELPEDLRALCDHNAFVLGDGDWKFDVERLARILRPRPAWVMALGLLGAIALSVGVAWLFLHPVDHFGCQASSSSPVIAVIPSEGGSPEPEERRLRIGLANDLVDRLSEMAPESLQVISLGSVMPFLDTHTAPGKIARDLGATHVLTEFAFVVEDSMRITAEMSPTRSSVAVWRGSYRMSRTNLGAQTLAIAASIAGSLKVHLTPARIRALAHGSSRDPQAVEQYLFGRSFWDQRSEAGLRRAAWHYSAAVARDPNFAAAWARLADTYMLLSDYGFAPKDSCLERAHAAAQRAVEIDPDQSEAHATLGALMQSSDPKAAEIEFERALRLDPNDPLVLQRHADFQVLIGKPDAAVRSLERALRLDPGSYSLQRDLGTAHYYLGQFDDAAFRLRRAIALEPGNPGAYDMLSAVLFRSGRSPAAIETVATAARLRGESPEITNEMIAAFHSAGVDGYWKWKLERTPPDTYASAYALAALGERDSAMSELERVPPDDPDLPTAKTDPVFREFRSNARFKRIIAHARSK